MARSARVAACEPGEEKGEPAAAVTHAVTGFEDPAISEVALAAAEASRRAYDTRRYEGLVGGRKSARVGRMPSFFVYDNGAPFTLDDWLAKPYVARELRKTDLALSEVANGTGSIKDVNMHYAFIVADFDAIDRFVKAGGGWREPPHAARAHAERARAARAAHTAVLAFRLFVRARTFYNSR